MGDTINTRRSGPTTSSTVTQSAPGCQERGARFSLVVVGDARIHTVELPIGSTVRVGRGPECEVVVHDAAVSRHHLTIYGSVPPQVEDVGSRNGTAVQGRALAPNQRVVVEGGHVINIGAINIFVRDDALAVLPAPPQSSPTLPNALASPSSRNPVMIDVYEKAKVIAQSPMPVLILGETGVGKELLAERLHAYSPRRDRPLVRVNCAALAEGILASELFGHEKGAFTGAHASKLGFFEAADGGTLFMDEVGELTPATQAQLLRVLETGEVTRLGSHRSKRVDVRILCATNRELAEMVRQKRFRADLFFRINGISLKLPPLRRRKEDILPLAQYFATRFAERLDSPTASFSADAQAAMVAYRWPGNVRELKNVVERAALLSHGEIRAEELQLDGVVEGELRATQPPSSSQRFDLEAPSSARAPLAERGTFRTERPPRSTRSPSRLRTSKRTEQLKAELQNAERERIIEALAQAKTQAAAAQLLGMSRRSLINRLVAYGIPRPRKK